MYVDIRDYNEDDSSRKIQVQVEKFDCWNLDNTLAIIIHASLRTFRERVLDPEVIAGVPSAFFDSDEDLDIDAANARWADALDQMIWSFSEIAEQKPNEPDLPDQMNDETREIWRQEIVAYHARIQSGIDLFAKHFTSLWE